MRLTHTLLTAALAAAFASPLQAADAVTDAIQVAYAPYRAALSRTNGKSVPEARQAVLQAQSAWQDLVQRLGGQPVVAPYDRDAAFRATLAQVSKVYEQAAAEVGDGQLPAAHATLEAVREQLADLRRRNQVVVFSDHMNAFHAEMEHLLADGPKALAEPQGLPRLVARVGALDHLAGRLRQEAPSALKSQPEFDALLQALEGSMGQLKTAALAMDAAALRDAMGKVKPAYSKLFIRFG
ncbi:hypothetical protein [Ideonella sp. A 288]|uniref:hypothetical protein n=1 Tax=Ideonella sp. A 288 TaxID=1962181 RepID=UPI000B4AB6BB|nr:hypothetical protein [Ideonella sp. A 288]